MTVSFYNSNFLQHMYCTHVFIEQIQRPARRRTAIRLLAMQLDMVSLGAQRPLRATMLILSSQIVGTVVFFEDQAVVDGWAAKMAPYVSDSLSS